MQSTEEKLARYRANKKKEYHNSQNSAKFSKPTPTGTERRYIWNRIWDKVRDSAGHFGIVDKLKNILPPIPILGWELFLKVLLWLILYMLFLELEFGMVFLLLSGFYFIYSNTRTRSRLENEPSAYSVFNPNCQRLQGSLTAEQFESEIRYGSGSVH
ncbi:SAYSvFN domain-containing protein 1-like [Styela clava]